MSLNIYNHENCTINSIICNIIFIIIFDFFLFFELSKCISLILVDFHVFVTLYDITTPTDLMCFLPTTKNLMYKIYMSI